MISLLYHAALAWDHMYFEIIATTNIKNYGYVHKYVFVSLKINNRRVVTMGELTYRLKPAQQFSSQSTVKLKPKGQMRLLAH